MRLKVAILVGLIVSILVIVTFILVLKSGNRMELATTTLQSKNSELVSPSPSPTPRQFDSSSDLEIEVDELLPEDFSDDFTLLKQQL